MIKRIPIFIIYFTLNSALFTYPYVVDIFQTEEVKERFSSCTTIEYKNLPPLFDSNTKVTFYGDSRMQLAHFLLTYGIPFVGLDFFLGALPEGWNVQNFGISGMTSGGLYDHLLNCLPANGDKAPFPENYKIAKNVAFHIGGNDFFGYTPLIAYMPWKSNDVKNLVYTTTKKLSVCL